MNTTFKPTAFATALSLILLPNVSSAGVIGFLGNFDVINDTGSEAHGFEIDLEGLHSTDITDTFGGAGRGFPSGRGFDPGTSVQRYGAPSVTEYNNGSIFGTKVTYYGLWNNGSWDYGTPAIDPANPNSFVTPGDNCWSGGGVGYGASTPCDHFGVGTVKNPTKTTYSWLHDDGSNSGTLTNINGQAILPAPVWNVVPNPAQPDAQPVVAAQIQAPAAENEAQFGEALWVKVFRTELEKDAKLEDLIGGNPIIDNAVTEIEWQLLQTDPGNPNAGKLEQGYQNVLGANAEAVIYRYEFYKYSGDYDQENHEALVGSDSHPADNELGAYLGAQNGAVNLNAVVPAVPVPPAFVLMGTGLLGFVANRRSRLKKHL